MNLSEQLFQRSLQVAPGGVHSPVRGFKGVGGSPIFFKKASGAYLTSVDDQSYIDFCQSFGPNLLGHRDPDVEKVLREAIGDAWTFGAADPYSLELAEFLVQNIPHIQKLRFVCSGTEAVMSALRIARAATQRTKILKFEGCYHGHVDSMLVKAGSGLAGDSASDSAGVPQNQAADTLVIPLNDPQALDMVLRTHGDEIAAVILEPLPANFGLLIQEESFLRTVFDKVKAVGGLVIFDEVISGFRVGFGGMAQRLNLQPDLVTFGKVLGGGFPIGAYAGSAELLDLVAPSGPVYQAGTLAANPVGIRAGLATLQKVKRLEVYKELEERTQKFCQDLIKGFQEDGVPMTVSHYTSLFWLHYDSKTPVRSVKDFHPKHKDFFAQVFHKLLARGVYLAPNAYEVGFVSWAHTPEILEKAKQSILESVKEVSDEFKH